MQKLMIIMLIGWMAMAVAEVRAAPSLVRSVDERPSEALNLEKADFEALERYLIEKVPQDDGMRKELALIKSEMGILPPGIKEAGHVMVALLEAPSKGCSKELISMVMELDDPSISMYGLKRLRAPLSYGYRYAYDNCKDQL